MCGHDESCSGKFLRAFVGAGSSAAEANIKDKILTQNQTTRQNIL